jgi:hypothetical protein
MTNEIEEYKSRKMKELRNDVLLLLSQKEKSVREEIIKEFTEGKRCPAGTEKAKDIPQWVFVLRDKIKEQSRQDLLDEVERKLPMAEEKHWAVSQKGIGWNEYRQQVLTIIKNLREV